MTREQRLVFGEVAELYDLARPAYPATLIDDVVAFVGSHAWALDTGCGTGKATVLLAQRQLRGVGVDADASMAGVARRNLARYPGWRVDVANFESWRPDPNMDAFDLVVSADAWHWFEPDSRFRKAHSLLRAGGWLALWWNGPADVDSPTRRAIAAAYERHAPEIVHRGMGYGPPSQEGAVPADASFGPPIERAYAWSMDFSSAEWIDLLRTSSDHRMLPDVRSEKLLAAVRAAVDAHGGTFTYPCVSYLWAAERI
ncbi:MAG TPA: class I SAM-dependent methyltransferase [Candidatus Dormibacteraeota bacterium]|nr:class I SAM-dependent methyltransferase [Candidatus Dormibacteraeota bacterium]